MTARGAIVLLLLGIGLGVIGALLKILHWPYGNAVLTASSAMELIAVIALGWKVWSYPGFKDFLDR